MKENDLNEQTRVPIGWLYGLAACCLGAAIMISTYAVSLATWKTTTDIRITNLESSTALQRQQLDALNEMNARLSNIEGQLSVINTRSAREAKAREKGRE